jgi:hypothetical protein
MYQSLDHSANGSLPIEYDKLDLKTRTWTSDSANALDEKLDNETSDDADELEADLLNPGEPRRLTFVGGSAITAARRIANQSYEASLPSALPTSALPTSSYEHSDTFTAGQYQSRLPFENPVYAIPVEPVLCDTASDFPIDSDSRNRSSPVNSMHAHQQQSAQPDFTDVNPAYTLAPEQSEHVEDDLMSDSA